MSAKDQVLELVNKFKKENYLKDKTNAMGDGLLLGANLADDANELSKSVDVSFKRLQQEYTENGNGAQSTAELITARDGEMVINDRLLRDFGNVDFQLAHTIQLKNYAKGDGTDETELIQQAINDSVGKTLLWNKQSGTKYVTRPLFIPSNVKIEFQSETIVEAKPGYASHDCVLNTNDKENITIEGNYATIQMLKEEYIDGEWRHCLTIFGSKNVTVDKLNLNNSGGDGVIIGGGLESNKKSENIEINNCLMDGNKRQGVSVVGNTDNVTVDGCLISNTGGTDPSAGIDIEPNDSLFDNENTTVKNCVLKDNVRGILVNENSYNVKVINNKLINSGSILVKRFSIAGKKPTAEIDGNEVAGSSDAGIYIDSVDNIVVRNNVVSACAYGIMVEGNVSTTYGNQLISNRVFDIENDGIQVTSCEYADVYDNLIENCLSHGVLIVGSNNSMVDKNTLFGCGSSTKDGIKISTSTNSKVLNNIIRKSSKDTRFGVYVDASSNNVVIEGNDLYDAAVTKAIYSESTQTVIGTNTDLDGTKPVYTVYDFMPTANKNWVGRMVAFKKVSEKTRIYTGIEKIDGTFDFEEVNVIDSASSIPTTGKWSKGAIVWNENPQLEGFIGWVCLTAGTPGVWRGFGKIDI